MKKILLTTACLAMLNMLNAQSIFFNRGFETWSNSPGYNEPEYWHSLNVLSTFSGAGYEESTVVTTDAYKGDRAAVLTSQLNQFQNIPGVLSSGALINSQGEPDLSNLGIPYTWRPLSFEFYAKYTPQDGDSALAYMMLTKWNTTTQQRDTIGFAILYIPEIIATYTKKTAAFVYQSSQTPDSCSIFISSSFDGFNPSIGSELYVDEFAVNFPVGIADNNINAKIASVYPNPASTQIHFSADKPSFSVSVYNVQGKLVAQTQTLTQTSTINTSVWPAGIYCATITQHNSTQHIKFIVK